MKVTSFLKIVRKFTVMQNLHRNPKKEKGRLENQNFNTIYRIINICKFVIILNLRMKIKNCQ